MTMKMEKAKNNKIGELASVTVSFFFERVFGIIEK